MSEFNLSVPPIGTRTLPVLKPGSVRNITLPRIEVAHIDPSGMPLTAALQQAKVVQVRLPLILEDFQKSVACGELSYADVQDIRRWAAQYDWNEVHESYCSVDVEFQPRYLCHMIIGRINDPYLGHFVSNVQVDDHQWSDHQTQAMYLAMLRDGLFNERLRRAGSIFAWIDHYLKTHEPPDDERNR